MTTPDPLPEPSDNSERPEDGPQDSVPQDPTVDLTLDETP